MRWLWPFVLFVVLFFDMRQACLDRSPALDTVVSARFVMAFERYLHEWIDKGPSENGIPVSC